VVVGGAEALVVDHERLTGVVWADAAARSTALTASGVTAQASAHGEPVAVGAVEARGDDDLVVRWLEPQRRVAPGQSVVLYDTDVVLGGGIVTG